MKALSSESSRLDTAEAERLCGRAARMLAAAMKRENNIFARPSLTSDLSSMLAPLNTATAELIGQEAIRSLIQAQAEDLREARRSAPFEAGLVSFLSLVDPRIAKPLARELADFICNYNLYDSISEKKAPASLSPLLAETSRQIMTERASRLAAMTVGMGISGMLVGPTWVAAEPLPCRLSTQELVDLLKMPTCFGENRRVVLEHLGNIHGRRFANHWQFVRFAREKGLDLDFTTPRAAPIPRQRSKRMLDLLPPDDSAAM